MQHTRICVARVVVACRSSRKFRSLCKDFDKQKRNENNQMSNEVAALLSLAVKLCPNHSSSSSALLPVSLPPFATLFRCTQRLFGAEAGAKSCSRCSRGSSWLLLFWPFWLVLASLRNCCCGMWHAACGMRHTACVFLPDNILIGSTAEHLVQSGIKMNQFV